MASATFTITVDYDPEVTDPGSVASALDTLMGTATSTPGILEEHGDPTVGDFYPLDEEARDLLEQLRSLLKEPDIDDAEHNLREVHKLLGVPVPSYLDCGCA